jgi:toxin-antitoxin system PIN domain toxin
MRYLCDSSVLLALTLAKHSHHDPARTWLATLVAGDTLVMCRMVEMTFLRLLSQPLAPGYEPVTNAVAVEKLQQWRKLPFVERSGEPDAMDAEWLRYAGADRIKPKRWMDAYLATFAMSGRMRFVTFDADFEFFRERGLDLVLLKPGQ